MSAGNIETKKRNFVTGIVTLRYAKALCILQRPSNHAIFAVLMNERSEPSIINIVFMKFINAPTACTFGSFVICRRKQPCRRPFQPHR